MHSLLQAVAFLSAAKFLFAFQDVIIKEMSGAYPVHQIVVVRSLVALVILLLIIGLTAGFSSLKGRRVGLHLLRGALMFVAFVTYYIALSVMPLTTATALFFTAPFFITLLAIPILGEKVGPRRITGVVVGFIGVLIVLRPDTRVSLVGILPIISALFYALCQILARRVALTESAQVMTFYANLAFALLGLTLAAILSLIDPPEGSSAFMQFLLRDWQLPTLRDSLLLAATGITAAVGFLLGTHAYRISEVNQLAPFEYVMLVWVSILSYLVWSELPDGHTILGAAVIIAAGLYVLRREESAGVETLARGVQAAAFPQEEVALLDVEEEARLRE